MFRGLEAWGKRHAGTLAILGAIGTVITVAALVLATNHSSKNPPPDGTVIDGTSSGPTNTQTTITESGPPPPVPCLSDADSQATQATLITPPAVYKGTVAAPNDQFLYAFCTGSSVDVTITLHNPKRDAQGFGCTNLIAALEDRSGQQIDGTDVARPDPGGADSITYKVDPAAAPYFVRVSDIQGADVGGGDATCPWVLDVTPTSVLTDTKPGP